MTIQLPGYRAVYGNVIHVKHELAVMKDMATEPLAGIIGVGRFEEPTVYSVAEYLRKKTIEAQRNVKADFDESIVLEGKTPLETRILQLSDGMIQELREGNESIDFIRCGKLFAYRSEEEPASEYLYIRYEVTPRESMGNIDWIKYYQGMFSDDYPYEDEIEELLDIRVLLDNMTVPKQKDIDHLLKHGVCDSRVLKVLPQHYCTKEAREVVEAVYASISTPDHIRQLTDLSEDVLEAYADCTILELLDIDEEAEIEDEKSRFSNLTQPPDDEPDIFSPFNGKSNLN